MKKLLTALMITGIAYYGANAQTEKTSACGVNKGQVCRMAPGKKTASCYKTRFAENYKVCKNEQGYYICCEAPKYNNSTFASVKAQTRKPQITVVEHNDDDYVVKDVFAADIPVPQSQSYVIQSSGSYSGYYPKNNKKRIKVCYTGNNVAANNRAPYEGCPSPQYEGPEANNQRNLNVSNPMPMPPLSGRPME